MTMPILPGLIESDNPQAAGETPDDGTSDLGMWLDSLDDDQVAELETAAEEHTATAAGDDAATGDDTAPDGPEDKADADAELHDADEEATETPEDEAAETPDEQDAEAAAGVEDLGTIVDQAAADVEDAAGVVSDLEKMAGDKDNDQAGDIAKLAKQAAGIQARVERAAKDCEKAAKKEDVAACAQAGVTANELLDQMQHLLEAAKSMGQKTVVPEMTTADHPAIKTWANHMAAKKTPQLPVG